MSEIAELLERFRRGPEVVALVLTGVHGEEIDWTPEPGRWSIRTIAAHLADSEIVGAHRFRVVIAEENPVIQAYDEKAWAERLDYARRKPSASLETFRRARQENYELLRALPESAFERRGTHTERGPVTLLDTLRTYAEHAENHARQMQGVRDVYKEHKAASARSYS
jgi:hypothetical protein